MSDILLHLPNKISTPPDAARDTRFHEILQSDASTQNLRDMLDNHPGMSEFLSAILAGSPYLSSLIISHPDFTKTCLEEDVAGVFDDVISELKSNAREAQKESDIISSLRIAKQKTALLVALCDLIEVWDVMTCTRALTRLADEALQLSLSWLLKKEGDAGKIILTDVEDPQKECGYFVLALGKYGAGELNYSSDIDLIVFYDLQKTNLADGVEPGPFFVKVTKALTKLMSDVTSDGYVFRTDLRLRPDPSSTSVAISTDAAFSYYESVGQNWERAAMIKARPCAGDIDAGARFLSELQPFIWRKYLDYAAIADVHSIKRQIDQYKGHGKIAVKGHNIKLGRGGIREIEFFVQTQQLIAGGRNPQLRGRETLVMLQALVDGNWLSQQAADDLRLSYEVLRRLEHRLQMVNDRQTHHMPKDDDELNRFAHFAGYENLADMSTQLMGTLEKVQGHYEVLFENAPALSDEHGGLVFTGGEDDPETLETLSGLGFKNPEAVSLIIRNWHHGQARATRTARAREKLTELTPSLLMAFSKTSEPDRAFSAFDTFIRGLPAGIQLFSLLWSNPQLLSLLTSIIGNAPRLSEILSARPRLFDGVLQPDFFEVSPETEDYLSLFEESLAPAQDFQDKLDLARITAQEQVFRIGLCLLTGSLDEEEAGIAYTKLAESVINTLLEASLDDHMDIYGVIPGGRVVIIAMGKLGGFEMSATSDLDIMLIYDFDEKADHSDGKKSIAAGPYYTKLTQKLMASISAPTAEGRIYEVDMRLRPSGNSGPLATQFSGFVDYQKKSAWTWEKMALTRARVIAGDESLQKEITHVIRDNLSEERDLESTRKDVNEMRLRIWKERGSDNIWDIKQAPGGLIDLEFIVQYLQLIHGHHAADCLNQNLPTSIQEMAKAKIIEKEEAAQLISAHGLYQKIIHITRICLTTLFDPEAVPEGLKMIMLSATNEPEVSTLTAKLKDNQRIVKSLYEKIIGINLES